MNQLRIFAPVELVNHWSRNRWIIESLNHHWIDLIIQTVQSITRPIDQNNLQKKPPQSQSPQYLPLSPLSKFQLGEKANKPSPHHQFWKRFLGKLQFQQVNVLVSLLQGQASSRRSGCHTGHFRRRQRLAQLVALAKPLSATGGR